MKNLDNLSGKALDEFGKKHGIPRYVGAVNADTDDQYREILRKATQPKFTHVPSGSDIIENSENGTQYGVFRMPNFPENKPMILKVWNGDGRRVLAIFDTREEAEPTLVLAEAAFPTHQCEIIPIKLPYFIKS